jgi:type VI secretion system secreted protein VgrG
LNTPRTITNQAKQKRWEWNSDPFGTTAANENPAALGTFTFNLRFAGQYFDKETGLHYNYFRDYNPAIGRYVQSDPIGLRGGLNTFGYVEGNPANAVDPLGLFNYAKGAVAIGNFLNGGRLLGTGGAKIAAGAGVSATGVGIPVSAGSIAWGTWNIKSALAAAKRAKQQWGEACNEQASDASWKNLRGLLPFGQHYDDPQESFSEFAKYELRNISVGRIIVELGTLGF